MYVDYVQRAALPKVESNERVSEARRKKKFDVLMRQRLSAVAVLQ